MAAPIRATILGRETQLAELATVAGLHSQTDSNSRRVCEPAPPLVVVYGGVSTGKSLTVHHALDAHAEFYAMVDCTGVTSARAFYREILGQLQKQKAHRNDRAVFASGVQDQTAHGEELLAEVDDDEITITDAPVEARVTPRKRTATSSREAKQEHDSEEESSASESEDEDKRTIRSTRFQNKKLHKAEIQETEPPVVSTHTAMPAESSLGSLNFLSFVKTLRVLMDGGGGATTSTTSSSTTTTTVFITLDHVEKLLDRGLDKLITCLLAVNDQLDYLNVFDDDDTSAAAAAGRAAPWRLSVVLVARAVSLSLDLFLHGAHPAFVHFPAYTKDQVAAIVAQNLVQAASFSPVAADARRLPWLRKWLVYVYDLLPHTHSDWLEFQHVVAQMLPSFHEFFDIVSQDDHAAQLPQVRGPLSSSVANTPASSTVVAGELPSGPVVATDVVDVVEPRKPPRPTWAQLQRVSQTHIASLERSRRRHLFGYDNVGVRPPPNPTTTTATSHDHEGSQDKQDGQDQEIDQEPEDAALAPVTSGDPVAFIASSKLSRSCLLLLVAAYLASFTPHEADSHFVSGSGGVRRKRRIQRITIESGGSNGTTNETKGPNSKKNDLSTAAARKAMNQQLVGPKIFQLPRLLAIYASLQLESDAAAAAAAATTATANGSVDGNGNGNGDMWAAGSYRPTDDQTTRTRADIFTHLSLLVRLRLLQRASPPSDLEEPLFRCVADTRLVDEIARRLHFPLDSYLNTRG